jgi:hypothetical protein
MTQSGEVFYNIFIEFGIPTKLVSLTEICIKEKYIMNSEQVKHYAIPMDPASYVLGKGGSFPGVKAAVA